MSLIELKDVSKIYTTKDNVEVGISNINLMLDKNEVVAITGKSGAGKSTLLRVLGGLESYEKGEMYFNGNPTSSYDKEDWSNYLKENISFIFQEYNILESFTVLENVEFALTKIKDRQNRKEIALKIIERVGLKDRINYRGSELSGGEKQRTVIARAVAKDSPIILADEPTGNLDSKTSKEILELLKEISKDKLLVIVTHNYEDVKDFATRHIRVFDGKIDNDDKEYDESKSSYKKHDYDFKDEHAYIFKEKKKKEKQQGDTKCNFIDSLSLGLKRYVSRPKQTILITLLFIVVVILLFVINIGLASIGNVRGFDKDYLGAAKQDNRVALIKQDSSPIYKEDLDSLVGSLNALGYVKEDYHLDSAIRISRVDNQNRYYNDIKFGTKLNLKVDEGRGVENNDEIVLRIPYTLKGKYNVGENVRIEKRSAINYDRLLNKDTIYKVVGIDYVFGELGIIGELTIEDSEFLCNSYESFILDSNDNEISIGVDYSLSGKDAYIINYHNKVDYSLEEFFYKEKDDLKKLDLNILEIKKVYKEEYYLKDSIYVSKELYKEKIIDNLNAKQASLYFASEGEAFIAEEALNDMGYKALASSRFIKVEGESLALKSFYTILIALAFGAVLAFSLMNIVRSTREDLYIFRTMGIEDNVIKGSTYLHMLLSVIPAVILLIVMYLVVYLTPLGANVAFVSYEVIIGTSIALLFMSILVAFLYNRILYSSKINKGLRRTNK